MFAAAQRLQGKAVSLARRRDVRDAEVPYAADDVYALFRPAGGTLLTLVAPFVNIQFLGSSLTFMMVRDRLAACALSLQSEGSCSTLRLRNARSDGCRAEG